MLNNRGERELCYVTKIDDIQPIQGSDNCECAVVGGWHIMVRKGQFKVGNPAIYFEIDSKVPAIEPFLFLEAKKYHIKTQKYTFGGKGNFISQGLLMHPEDFGWKIGENGNAQYIIDENGKAILMDEFLTKRLGVIYYEPEDNARKAASADKYQLMRNRHQKLFKHKFFSWLYKFKLGKKILFLFLGKKKDNRASWPAWVAKTDEERAQNLPNLFPGNDETWFATEKIDGSSTTFTMRQGPRKKRKIFVCSRNVCFDKPDAKCFYETNIYTEMAEKYHMEEVLNQILDDHSNWEYITIQGETYGGNIQKRDYGPEHRLAIFNVIYKDKNANAPRRLNPREMIDFINSYNVMGNFNLECVPLVDEKFKIPATCDELLTIAEGISIIDSKPREGLVFRSQDGVRSFKAVSNSFLLKYHS